MKQRQHFHPSFRLAAPAGLTAAILAALVFTGPASSAYGQTIRRQVQRLPRPVRPAPLLPTRRTRAARPAGLPGGLSIPSSAQPGARSPVARPPIAGLPARPVVKTPAPVAKNPVPGKPWLVWESTTYDFGRKLVSEKVEGEFILRNTGEADLHITKVRAGCGCTATQYDRVIKPGAVGRISFRIDPKRIHGKSTKNITVETDCPGHPKTILRATGEVYRILEVKPRPRVTFRVTDKSKPMTQTLEVLVTTDDQFEILSVTSDNPTFVGSVEPIEAGKKYRLTIKAVPPFKNGSNIGRLTITTNLEKQKTTVVTASAYVTPRLRVSPTLLSVAVGENAAEQKRRITLINTGKTPVDILEVKSSDPALTTTLLDNPRTNMKYIQVTVPANYKPKPGTNTITITTNDEEFKSFTIPIRTRAARPRVSSTRSRTTFPQAVRSSVRTGATAQPPIPLRPNPPAPKPVVKPAGEKK